MSEPRAERPAGESVPPMQGLERGWIGYLPSLIVVLALVALFIAPTLVQRRTERLRSEIANAADPGRTLVTEIQYLLARQTSALRGFLITRDPSYLERYRAHAAEERQALQALDSVARRLGPEVQREFGSLRALSAAWHQGLEVEMGEMVRGAGRAVSDPLPFDQQGYIDALEAGNRLDEAILRAAQERRGEIQAIERRARFVTGALILLALLAAASVTWLGSRVRRLAREAERRREEAERALDETARTVESRAMLIRGVTHDVKNPLGVADGYADLLEMGLKGELTPAQAEVIGKIRRSIQSALGIIGDLLELSRAESGGLPLRWQRTDPRLLVERVVDEYREMVETAGQSLEVDLPEQPPPLRSDADRVRQVLENLLSNAVKYTPAGGRIAVRLCVDGGPAHRGGEWVGIEVSDTGPGIPEEHRERLFSEFYRVPGATASGHGLGLAISRRIARLLGGEITVESEPGQGSTFTLWLPVQPPGAAPPVAAGGNER